MNPMKVMVGTFGSAAGGAAARMSTVLMCRTTRMPVGICAVVWLMDETRVTVTVEMGLTPPTMSIARICMVLTPRSKFSPEGYETGFGIVNA